MIASRRITRIRRWLSAAKGWHPSVYKTHVEGRKNTPSVGREYERFLARLDRANRLFAAELAWLCEYATTLAESLYVVDGYTVSPPTFVCSNCQRDTPWSEGAADSHPDLCNDCIPEAQP